MTSVPCIVCYGAFVLFDDEVGQLVISCLWSEPKDRAVRGRYPLFPTGIWIEKGGDPAVGWGHGRVHLERNKKKRCSFTN